jgi:hypothetical protein
MCSCWFFFHQVVEEPAKVKTPEAEIPASPVTPAAPITPAESAKTPEVETKPEAAEKPDSDAPANA